MHATPHDIAPRTFLVADRSGRGVVARLTSADILATWDSGDIDNSDPGDEYAESFREWIDRAEIGDTYHHDGMCADVTRVD